MEYGADYRKLIFREVSRLLSTLSAQPPRSLYAGYFAPAETNVEVLGLFASALKEEYLSKSNNVSLCDVWFVLCVSVRVHMLSLCVIYIMHA